MELIENSGNGSVFQEISKSTFKSLALAVPDNKILDDFNKIIEQLFCKIRCNQHQIQILQKLRNTLLPKLISGEVRVKNQEA
jgi:type I restriction enzyme S subunit